MLARDEQMIGFNGLLNNARRNFPKGCLLIGWAEIMKVTRIKAGRIRPEAVPEFRKSAPLLKELGKHAIPTTAHGA